MSFALVGWLRQSSRFLLLPRIYFCLRSHFACPFIGLEQACWHHQLDCSQNAQRFIFRWLKSKWSRQPLTCTKSADVFSLLGGMQQTACICCLAQKTVWLHINVCRQHTALPQLLCYCSMPVCDASLNFGQEAHTIALKKSLVTVTRYVETVRSIVHWKRVLTLDTHLR